MPDTVEHAVIATFDSGAQAEQAAQDLMRWDKVSDEIEIGAIGVVTKDAQGELVTNNYSQRNTGKGAKVGMSVGVLAAVLSGGLTLIPTVVGGAVAGGALGALSKKGLGLTDTELEGLRTELADGRAAVLVMCDAGQVEPITAELEAAGGTAHSHVVSTPEFEEAAEARSVWPGGLAVGMTNDTPGQHQLSRQAVRARCRESRLHKQALPHSGRPRQLRVTECSPTVPATRMLLATDRWASPGQTLPGSARPEGDRGRSGRPPHSW